MNGQTLEQLRQEQSSAKAKMILGIVFSSVAVFITFLWFALIIEDDDFFPLILFAMPAYGVGIPFLVTGIVNTVRCNHDIALINQTNHTYTQKVPQKEAPVPTPVYQQPAVQVQPQPQEAVQNQPEVSMPVNNNNIAPQSKNDIVIPLDWQKYNPLEAGVSYKKDKDYKFHRADGFAGSVPQKFVDRTFPRCPICCSNEPHWTISQHNQMSWTGNLYLFRCSHCNAIISMSMPDVTTLGNGASGIIGNPNVGLTNLLVKKSSGKEVGAVYAVIESVGTSGITAECEGKEFELEDLQDMLLRK